MPPRIADSLATSEPVAAIFSNRNVLSALLRFEVALARAESRVGIITAEEAAAVETAAVGGVDEEVLARQAFRAGSFAIPLVQALKEKGALQAHRGATSQDAADTALSLLLAACREVLGQYQERLRASLEALSDEHRDTVMMGRTLLQPATPVTFGLKAAGWSGALNRCWQRLDDGFTEACCLQFGGASGTLAAFGTQGLAVSEALARELGLPLPEAPWHTHRDRLAALACALAIYTAALGKMALDIALLMQFEVAEAFEPGGEGRGGSSTMPHKHNPTACLLTVAASRRAPGLVSNFLNGMPQEHERAAGGWQNEWTLMEDLVHAAAVAAECMAEVAEGLSVNPHRMRHNLESTGGAVYSERNRLGITEEAGGTHYLGSAEQFRRRLLGRKE